jgi:hypothetical protein
MIANFFDNNTVWLNAEGDKSTDKHKYVFQFTQPHTIEYGWGAKHTFQPLDKVEGFLIPSDGGNTQYLQTTSKFKAPTEKDFADAAVDAEQIILIPINDSYMRLLGAISPSYIEVPYGEHPLMREIKMSQEEKKEEKRKLLKKINNPLKNPFAEGYKKYVVIQDFTSNNILGERKFKVGMNLFAKGTNTCNTVICPAVEPMYTSYAGYSIPHRSIRLKELNVYERIQNFFKVKKGFA